MPPTIREIGKHFNFSSTGTVRDYLRALAEKGYIKMHQGKARSIELVKERIFQIPIVGRVRAGPAELAFEDVDGYVNLDNFLFNEDIFALRIKGDSLEGIGIREGDLALVKRQNTAMNNDIVIALINEDATAKILKIERGRIYLSPANDKYQPIELSSMRGSDIKNRAFSNDTSQDVQIIGRVLTVIRRYV